MSTNKGTKTVRVKLYQFDKLSDKAKDKAIEKLYDINVDYDWWDFTYDAFAEICATIGVEVDLKKTFHSGFSSQGDGAGFTADVDLDKLIAGIESKAFAEDRPTMQKDYRFTPDNCPVDKRVLKLIRNGFIDLSLSFEYADRYPRTKVEFSANYTYNEAVNYNNIDKQLETLEDWLRDTAKELDHLLYRMLETEYDYLTSKEAIIETIQANEYWFTSDGKISNLKDNQ